ncbi:TetR/AcrR family transcriptional regulator [Nocardia jejuensis]|uniref:TetR/AcrR family transcriptional regulator n=1 Tax=Nocardia jejuensis TaxID=328049 RepID=UPI0008322C83|nr:TetR/AcrR family transcriptional regulator [Nocardia jejuensis]
MKRERPHECTTARGRGRPRTGEEIDPGPLLEAALHAFADAGYEGMSVRALSRRLHISHALLIARYGSKEQLWFAAMEHALTEVERAWRAATDEGGHDDLTALRSGIVRQVLFAASYPQVVRIMNHEGAIDSPRIRFIVERFVDPLRPGVQALLDRLVTAGRIRALPYATLHFLITSAGSIQLAASVEARLLGADPLDTPDELQRHAETIADIILSGITTDPDNPPPGR